MSGCVGIYNISFRLQKLDKLKGNFFPNLLDIFFEVQKCLLLLQVLT